MKGFKGIIDVVSNDIRAENFRMEFLNPDRIINLEIKNERRTSIFNLEIKKKSGLSINPDIHYSKVFSSD